MNVTLSQNFTKKCAHNSGLQDMKVNILSRISNSLLAILRNNRRFLNEMRLFHNELNERFVLIDIMHYALIFPQIRILN